MDKPRKMNPFVVRIPLDAPASSSVPSQRFVNNREHGMMNHLKGVSPGVRLFFVLSLISMLFSACCPSGAYDDNFGRFYTLVTLPTDDALQTFATSGTVDTRDMGCGVWNIRPPGEGEDPVEPGDTSWVAVNPNPNPADQCCYAFRFDGQGADSECDVILGEYRNVGGKCEQSGQMFLRPAQ
jgi:hypothetical protein